MRLIDADELREMWLNNGLNEQIYDTNAVLDSIDNAPTIDQVKYGRWVITRNGNFIRNTCSVCNSFLDSDDSCIMDTYSYCPSCGARMDAP